MVIENVMYFALGFLAAALLGLMIMPSVWHRAVRLTRKRIEAATPMTMSEFRADKDQLRAEFALSSRRLEQNVAALRKRLTEQLTDVNQRRNELNILRAERDQQRTSVRELEEREADLRRRILDLEKEGADMAHRLRVRDRQLSDKVAELEVIHEGRRNEIPGGANLVGHQLSGEYARDVEELLSELATERERSGFLEDQVRALIERIERADADSAKAGEAIARLRERADTSDDTATKSNGELVEAEARIANAEDRLNALLKETQQWAEEGDVRTSQLLAEKLSLEEELEQLREKVIGVETNIMQDWEKERLEQSHLREQLNDIASDVSRLVYAIDGDTTEDAEESLFDRVQKFAGGPADSVEEIPIGRSDVPPPPRGRGSGRLSDRIVALRDLRSR
jgi:DNA repair exonuclease SbcCD ATPase subunit